MSSPAQPECSGGNFLTSLNCGAGTALNNEGTTINAFIAAIAGSFTAFAVQVAIFLLLRLRLSRIYRPRSYLVPERERVPAPPRGVVAWLGPLFTTPNLAFIQKCGLDAYFFLRYLRMLLKFFLPVALIVLPIMLPLNRYSGPVKNVRGLDLLGISNVSPAHVGHRLWAHLIMAIGVIVWFCYVVYTELRGYIRVRQAFLTSPQHRIRASATTVLVTGIPRKWLTLEALSGLYDVFPGGIKNIWINRNFDTLSDKVHQRDKIAKSLEGGVTDLIKKCRAAHEKKAKEAAKKEGASKKSKAEAQRDRKDEDEAAERMAQGAGTSAGHQHTTPHGLQDILQEAEEHKEREHEKEEARQSQYLASNKLGVVGEGLDKVGLGAVNQGLGALGHGFGALGKGIGGLGQKVVGGVDDGLRKAGREFNQSAEVGQGFVTDDDLYRQSVLSQSSDGAPTPPPKTPAVEREARLQANREVGRRLRLAANAKQAGAAFDDAAAVDQPTGRPQHPLSRPATVPSELPEASPTSETTMGNPEIHTTRPSVESKPRSQMEIEEPDGLQPRHISWRLWKNKDRSMALPSPQPHVAGDEGDEFPLTAPGTKIGGDQPKKEEEVSKSKLVEEIMFWRKKKKEHSATGEGKEEEEYPIAVDKQWDEDQDGDARWRRYIEPKQRDTLRLPAVNQSWFPSLPLIGKKVDKIYHLRRELARLNLEIETDQAHVEQFPFMNSAFIQFNHQVAAHMACQSLSHHVPQQMVPRLLEIAPEDVIWDNMSIKWWERYLRTGVVLAICAGLIVLYAVPVTFTSLLAHLDQLSAKYKWLNWVTKLPSAAQSIIQGLLPPVLLNLILILVPIIFRVLVRQQGVPTGNAKELGVQTWYFAFLFIQVFFVVTLSSGLTVFFSQLASQPGEVVKSLAQSLPRASTYFYQYLLVQALSNSAGALLQIGTLLVWFVLAPVLDTTPRQKWRRQTTLNEIQWGSFFPPFTNFAVIGIVYSVIAPFILFFMLIIFGLFWIVYRYNVLYIYQFRNDTGGLLFPTAVNQLFVGIYFMEVCLCGYFFISTGPAGEAACIAQGAVMIVVTVFTALYQWQLNGAFAPLFQFLPIALEDEAVIRDEEFARAQAGRFAPMLGPDANRGGGDGDDGDIQEMLEERERKERQESEREEEGDRIRADQERRHSKIEGPESVRKQGSWKHDAKPGPNSPTWKTEHWHQAAPKALTRIRRLARPKAGEEKPTATSVDPQTKLGPAQGDVEAQHTVGDVLFSGFADALEDLTPQERDVLVRYAFQHSALRAKRPVVWIPRDRLGVSDDEIGRARKMSTVRVPAEVAEGQEKGRGGGVVEKTNIWMSNEGTALDGRGKAVFRRSPPDFSNVDLIAL
ncbi:hypothetical protein LTR53_007859 [Teratosphaeriaceae sp. CCFEE 6253]|nr:hypothetical protein LTR53_007859 [Teratosphaeriaceae sp. CCFEE 6253]